MTDASRHEAITDQLRNEILRGLWAPGQRLPGERDLATRMGANRSSIREALRKLEQMGLVSVRRGGGTVVLELEEASLDVAHHLLFVDGRLNRGVMQQLLEAHEILVCGAARLAVERASEEELAEARSLIARLGDPATSRERYLQVVEALLDLIACTSQNWVLRIARRAVNPLFEERFRHARMMLRPEPHQVGPLAREATAAIESRNPDALENAVRHFLRMRRDDVLDALEALPVEAAPEDEHSAERSPHGH